MPGMRFGGSAVRARCVRRAHVRSGDAQARATRIEARPLPQPSSRSATTKGHRTLGLACLPPLVECTARGVASLAPGGAEEAADRCRGVSSDCCIGARHARDIGRNPPCARSATASSASSTAVSSAAPTATQPALGLERHGVSDSVPWPVREGVSRPAGWQAERPLALLGLPEVSCWLG